MQCNEDGIWKEEWEWNVWMMENGLEEDEREMQCDEDGIWKEEWEWKEREM